MPSAPGVKFTADEQFLPRKPGLPSSSAIELYRKIQHMAKKTNPKTRKARGYCFAQIATYAAWIGCSVRHTFRLIAELMRFEWIEKQVQPGMHIFLRPLVKRLPPRASHSPEPPEAWKKEMRDLEIPEGQVMPSRYPANDAPVQEEAVPHMLPNQEPPASTSYPSSSTENTPAMSGVLSSSVSSSPYKTRKWEKKQHSAKAKTVKNESKAHEIPAEAGAVVSLMHKCGVWEHSIPELLATIGIEALTDAFDVTLRRIEKGTLALEIGNSAGYALSFARRLKSGEWKLPHWLIKERSEAAGLIKPTAPVQAAPPRTDPVTNTPLPAGLPEQKTTKKPVFDHMQLPELERDTILIEAQEMEFLKDTYKGPLAERMKEKVRAQGWNYIGTCKAAEAIWLARISTGKEQKE